MYWSSSLVNAGERARLLVLAQSQPFMINEVSNHFTTGKVNGWRTNGDGVFPLTIRSNRHLHYQPKLKPHGTS